MTLDQLYDDIKNKKRFGKCLSGMRDYFFLNSTIK